MISCQKFPPHPLLANHIKFFFFYESDLEQKRIYQRITPDGCFELNFNLGGSISRKESDGREAIQRDLYVVSRVNHHYCVCSTDRIRMIGVRFFPWGIRPFISVPAWEIVDRLLTHQELFGRKASDLENRVFSARNPKDALEIIQKFCMRELYDERQRDMLVEDAARRILTSCGSIKMSSLQSIYNLSSRRIEQRFTDYIGSAPKELSRLARFMQALHLLRRLSDDVDFSDIVHKCGYFDQSHFNHDFKKFVGSTPTEYLAENHLVNITVSKPAAV